MFPKKLKSSVFLTFLFIFRLTETRELFPADRSDLLSDGEDQDDGTDGKVSLGSFETYAHDLRGEVTLLDDKTMEISGLNYDGTGPAAWFMVGKSDLSTLPEFVDLDGTVIPDDSESCDTLKAYRGDDVTFKLPGKMKFSDYNYISMYCLRFNHNFGYVSIPDDVKLKNGTSTVKECDQEEIEESEADSRPSRPRPRPAGPPPPPPPQQSGSGGLLGGLIDTVSGLLG